MVIPGGRLEIEHGEVVDDVGRGAGRGARTVAFAVRDEQGAIVLDEGVAVFAC